MLGFRVGLTSGLSLRIAHWAFMWLESNRGISKESTSRWS